VCQATGWTWDYVEGELTVPRLKALSRFWAQSPPPHMVLKALAQALGAWPSSRAPADAETSWADLRALGADPVSGIAIRGKAPL
jgi:hypothetical protein